MNLSTILNLPDTVLKPLQGFCRNESGGAPMLTAARGSSPGSDSCGTNANRNLKSISSSIRRLVARSVVGLNHRGV